MRYRKLDANGDMVFGGDQAAFLIDSPEAVAQAVETRMALQLGSWFLDILDGLDWDKQVLGKYTDVSRDMVIRERILGTTGVTAIAEYGSALDRDTRRFTVLAVIDTQYGQAVVQENL
jgi:hypothetical protein